jgi:hypothetical protein
MQRLAILFCALSLSCFVQRSAEASAESGGIRQVFLIQNSGWMEPFYLDPTSPLRPFMAKLIGQSNLQGVDVSVASFNQDGQVPGRRSPEIVFEGPYEKTGVESALERIDLPKKASGAYTDADFKGALVGTFERILKGQQGIIWIVTNNKDAPDNDPRVIENTRAFYGALRESSHITAIVAFPMRKEVAGPRYRERGLIIYGIAYGERGRNALNAVLRDGSPTRALFPAPPVKLKPLDVDPVELILDSNSTNVGARVVQGRLIIDGVPGGQENIIKMKGHVKNTFYPQNIAAANFSGGWRATDPAISNAKISISPEQLTNVPAAGLSEPIAIEVRLPKVDRLPGLSGMFEDKRVVLAEMTIKLDSMRFSLDPRFVARVSAISGGDTIANAQAEAMMSQQLPEVFMDYRKISTASMKVPVQISFTFSAWPLILMITLAALLLLALAFFFLVMSRARTYTVRIGSNDHRVTIRPREKRFIADGFGTRVELVGQVFGSPDVNYLQE